MKVLVVNPPNNPFTERSLLIEPIDVLGIASYIQSLGHEVLVKDMDVTQRTPESISKDLEFFKPEYTVIPFDYHIPLFRHEAIEGVNTIAKIATNNGSTPIIGGKTSNHYGDRFIKGTGGIIIIGEMEPALNEILSKKSHDVQSLEHIAGIIYNLDGILHHTAPRRERVNLNNLVIPDRTLLDLNQYIEVRTLLSSRGCIEKCSFCPVPEFWGYWKKREANLIVDEIEQLVNNFDAKKILFLDDHATVDMNRIVNISDEIIHRGIETTLGCLGTVSRYDPKTISKMQDAGFRWIHYGAELASQEILDYMNKKITVNQIKQAIMGTKNAGMRVRTSWIFDAPKTDENALDATIDLLLETAPDEIRAHYLTLRAGTPFARQIESENGAKLPPQYIHAGNPHSSFKTLSSDKILKKVDYLTTQLERAGYLVIRDPSQFQIFNNPKVQYQDTKIISFCPMRYGIGWTR